MLGDGFAFRAAVVGLAFAGSFALTQASWALVSAGLGPAIGRALARSEQRLS